MLKEVYDPQSSAHSVKPERLQRATTRCSRSISQAQTKAEGEKEGTAR
jgi:hypothetical protein